jgi:hypothetical protein
MPKDEIINDLRSSILKPMKTDYMSVWDLLELVCKQVELERVVQDDGVLIRREKRVQPKLPNKKRVAFTFDERSYIKLEDSKEDLEDGREVIVTNPQTLEVYFIPVDKFK